MPVTELNHYLIRANNLERTKDFYCKVLGFEVMPRPDFPFPGYWLGVDGKIQVHMAQGGVPNSELYYLGSPKNAAKDNSGVIDHIAFLATEPDKFRSEEHTSELQSQSNLVCRLLLEKKKITM